jgi:hypothetical protein
MNPSLGALNATDNPAPKDLVEARTEGLVQVDFSQIEDVESFVLIPEGRHLVQIAEIREGETRTGHIRWALRLSVVDGEFAGRTAAWDGLVWSKRGLPRVKHVLSVLGFDITGTLEVAPDDLCGRQAVVDFFVEEWENPTTGRRTQRLAVPFLGYEPTQDVDSPF